MNGLVKSVVSTALLSVLVGPALAAGSVVGVWHGVIRYDMSKLPANLAPAQRRTLEARAKDHEKDTISLEIKNDHSFVIIVTGKGTMPPPVRGTWTQANGKVSLQTTKPGVPESPKAFTLSKDGRTLTFSYGPTTMTFKKS